MDQITALFEADSIQILTKGIRSTLTDTYIFLLITEIQHI